MKLSDTKAAGITTGVYTINPDRTGMKVVYGEQVEKGYPDYLRDESNTIGFDVEALFFPKTNENIAYVLTEAQKKGIKVTLSGGRTGICAGAVPEGGYLLSMEKMNGFIAMEKRAGGYELTLEAGVRLSELANRLKQKDLGLDSAAYVEFRAEKKSYFYPPDPTETTATIGGTVATNASGAKTFFYGPTRNYITGLTVVLSSGEILKIRRGEVTAQDGRFRVRKEQGRPLEIPCPTYKMPKTKHAAGLYSRKSMDLIDLFIGSEGVLGVISSVTIRLIEEPSATCSVVAFFKSEEDALDFVMGAKQTRDRPLSLEYFDRDSLALLEGARKNQGPVSEIPEIPDSGSAVYFEFMYSRKRELADRVADWASRIAKCGGWPDRAWGALTKRDLLRLKMFRHTLPESINKIIARNKRNDDRIHKVGTDMAVPDIHLREMLACYREKLSEAKIDHVIFGHIGNSHLHVNMIPEDYNQLQHAKQLYKVFVQKAVSFGGTVSAEHGIGKLKKEYLRILFDDRALEEMRLIKMALDPRQILNQGDVI